MVNIVNILMCMYTEVSASQIPGNFHIAETIKTSRKTKCSFIYMLVRRREKQLCVPSVQDLVSGFSPDVLADSEHVRRSTLNQSWLKRTHTVDVTQTAQSYRRTLEKQRRSEGTL